MADKPENDGAASQIENSAERIPSSFDTAGASDSEPGDEIDENEIKELSQEEISALISPVSTDENAAAPEGPAKDGPLGQRQALNGVTGEIEVQADMPIQRKADRLEPHSEVNGVNESVESKGVTGSPDIEHETGPGVKNARVDADTRENLSDTEPPGGDLTLDREPDPDSEGDGEHDLEITAAVRHDDAVDGDDEEPLESADEDICDVNGSGGPEHKSHTAHIRTLGTVLAGCLILVGICGFVLIRNHRPAPLSKTKLTSPVASSIALSGSTTEQEDASPGDFHPEAAAASAEHASDHIPQNLVQENQEQLEKVRNQMLVRAGILTDLQGQYRSGIGRLEEEIRAEIRYGNIQSLDQVHKKKKIEYQLHAIQRRLGYIEQLEKPVRWLNNGSEELLFLQRKHNIESLVMPVCREITTERLIAEGNAAMSRYAHDAVQAQLKVDLETARYPSLSQIWQSVQPVGENTTVAETALGQKGPQSELSGGGESARNQAIWREICTGQFDRKCHLTALSADAASCLAAWSEPDLFINRVYRLTPNTARNLLKWKGKWLGLNGLVSLSPEAAGYLFNWDGEWVSLNGLTYLDAASSAYLVKWKGKTLEMMGLSSELMARDPLALKHLSAWQKKGNKLYVTDEVRELIEAEG